MHVVFGVVRQVKIDHARHVGNIQAPSRNIGGDQNRYGAIFELVQCGQALGLRLIAVQRARIDLSALQKPSQIAGFDFGINENHGLLDRFLAQQLRQRTAFVVFVLHTVHRLCDVGRGGIALRGFNQNRLVLVGFGQFANFAGEGCGKQQRLALFRQEIQNALQIG